MIDRAIERGGDDPSQMTPGMMNSSLRRAAWLACLSVTIHVLPAQTPPTWSSEIACILYNNCSSCHHEGGIAPFSLTGYSTAYAFRQSIRRVVLDREMPPWPPDPAYRSFVDQRVLSEEEIAAIVAWVDSGAPEGDPAQTPLPPTYDHGDLIAQPDLRVELPAYASQAAGADEYRCFVVPLNTDRDQYITAMEIIPGNPGIVHHVLVFVDESDRPIINDARDPDPGYLCFGSPGSTSAQLIGGWVPGQQPVFFPAGMGAPLPRGANLVVQVHYPSGSAGQMDRTHVNFELTDNPSTREVQVVPALNHVATLTNGPLYIPANTVKTFHAQLRVPADVTAFSVLPHMHLLGRSIRVYAVTPDRDTIRVIDIPHWDFHWQGNYYFPRAVHIPAFTMLHAEATYDNTRNNPHNPSDPPVDVWVGEATTDEMMLVYFGFTTYRPGDEWIVLGEVERPPVSSCAGLSSRHDPRLPDQAVQLFPNPAGHRLTVRPSFSTPYTVRLFHATGRLLLSTSPQTGDTDIDTGPLPAGFYLVELINPQGRWTGKVVRE